MIMFVIVVFAILFATPAFGQLTLDESFNAGVTDGNSVVYASAIQPDGKILVGGNFEFLNGALQYRIARLHPDGSRDTSFNSGGVGPNGVIFDIQVLDSGKIIIAGSFSTYNNFQTSRVARLDSDGTIDPTFQAGLGLGGVVQGISVQTDGKYILSGSQLSWFSSKYGVVRLNQDGTIDEGFTSPFTGPVFVEQTTIMPDGKLIVGGSFRINLVYFNVARLNSNGALDTTFAANEYNGSVFAVFRDADNKILIGGEFTTINAVTRRGLVRLTGDGVIDETFDPQFETSFSNPVVEYLAFRPDGRIIVAGRLHRQAESIAIQQLNSNGSIDASFNPPRFGDGGYHVTLLPDNKVLVTGYFDDIGTSASGRHNVARINPDGMLDDTFTANASMFGSVAAMLSQPDGKYVVAGDFFRGNGSPHRSFVRFNADGTVDEMFQAGWGLNPAFYSAYLYYPLSYYVSMVQQPDGKMPFCFFPRDLVETYDGFRPTDFLRINPDGSPDSNFDALGLASGVVHTVFALPDGKMLVGGARLGVSSTPLGSRILVRLNPDGSLDPTFTHGTTNINSPNYVRKVLRQPDGKLIVFGTFENYLGSNRAAVVRINENGTIDTSFVGSGFGAMVMALQSDGKVILAGNSGSSYVVRLRSNGTNDSTFTPALNLTGMVTSMVVQPDDKIIIGGTFTVYNGQPANKLARLNPDGTLDMTVTSGLDSEPLNMVSSIIPTADGHILIGGVFSNYGGVPRNNIAKLRIDDLDGTMFDYDGDGRTDYSVFRPSTGAWYLQRSTAGFLGLQFGADGDKLTPADYDGDGKTDISIYRPSTGIWYRFLSATNTVDYPVFGIAEDVPAPGDYDGDGKADLNVFRPSQGTWYRQNSSNGSFFGFQFGATGDVPTVGDFDGDGRNDLGIWRPSNGDWYNIRSSNGSVFGERFGQTGDKIAPADYDGDGKTDIAIFRPSTGLWVVRNSATATYSYSVFGAPNDIPIPGDYDGDGKADVGVWRPSDGTWYIQRSDNGQFIVFPWGQSGDKPTPSAYGN